jgi:hypothetical protein
LEVVRALDTLLAQKQPITDAQCEGIHQLFLSEEKNSDTAKSAKSRLADKPLFQEIEQLSAGEIHRFVGRDIGQCLGKKTIRKLEPWVHGGWFKGKGVSADLAAALVSGAVSEFIVGITLNAFHGG